MHVAYDAAGADDRERDLIVQRYWRRQLVLTLIAVAVGTGAFQLARLSIRREAAVEEVMLADGRVIRSASQLATMWPAAVGVAAVLVVFGLLLVHAWRVAAFTFRRAGRTHSPVRDAGRNPRVVS